MARIFKSPNPDFKEIADLPSQDTNYTHPLSTRKNHPIPVAFQITSPFNRLRVLLPHTLVMHVNPSNLQETYNQKIERFQTRGGWQEQHWGQDLTELSGEGSTGAFMNIYTGLSSVIRQRTIAWDRYRDLHDLYLHNGSVYDPFGNIVLQGHVMVLYDRGTYIGTFRSFEVAETDDSPFAFKINWAFKIEHTISTVQFTKQDLSVRASGWQAPEFQAKNVPASKEETNPTPPSTSEEAAQQEVADKAAEDRRYQAAVEHTRDLDKRDPARSFPSPSDFDEPRTDPLDLNINRLNRS
jgi:hypothetical protein